MAKSESCQECGNKFTREEAEWPNRTKCISCNQRSVDNKIAEIVDFIKGASGYGSLRGSDGSESRD